MSSRSDFPTTDSSEMERKILMVSHGHPDFVAGGGEIAAYNLHKALRANHRFDSIFFARHAEQDRTRGGTALSGNGRESEILFYSSMSDWFKFSQPNKALIWNEFRQVLESTQPELVHFHHYLHLGLEMIREVKAFNTEIPIVMTLHEFFGICHNHGQMIRTSDQSRCERYSPADCANCFPEFTSQDFYLRERFIKSYFELVDKFISPSKFLAQRYIDWGLPAEKISVIENLQIVDVNASEKSNAHSFDTDTQQSKVKLSFFGNINRFKGVDVLLEAIDCLDSEHRQQIQVSINGHGLDSLREPFKSTMSDLMERTKDCVRFTGPYQRSELPLLMADTDWVVVPSRWWENSPMVIEEARQHGVPVLCSNIGGMAERVQDGVTGLHFTVSRPESLAEKIAQVVGNRAVHAEFAENMRASFKPAQAFDQHTMLYQDLLLADGQASPTKLRVA